MLTQPVVIYLRWLCYAFDYQRPFYGGTVMKETFFILLYPGIMWSYYQRFFQLLMI